MTAQPLEWALVEKGCGDPTYVIGPDLKVGDKIHVIEAAPVFAKIARLGAALEKCKRQRDNFGIILDREYSNKFANSELDAILETEQDITPITTKKDGDS